MEIRLGIVVVLAIGTSACYASSVTGEADTDTADDQTAPETDLDGNPRMTSQA